MNEHLFFEDCEQIEICLPCGGAALNEEFTSAPLSRYYSIVGDKIEKLKLVKGFFGGSTEMMNEPQEVF